MAKAVCFEHEILNGAVKILLTEMNIRDLEDALDEDSKRFIRWVASQLIDGKIEGERVLTAWERIKKQGLPINEAIRLLCSGICLEQTL